MSRYVSGALFFLAMIAFAPAWSCASSRNDGVIMDIGHISNPGLADTEPDNLADQDPSIEEEAFLLEEELCPWGGMDPFILFPGDMKKMIDPDFCLGDADASLDPGIIIK